MNFQHTACKDSNKQPDWPIQGVSVGEAKRRGTWEQRKAEAIRRSKEKLLQQLGGVDERNDKALKVGMSAFLSRLPSEQWRSRKEQIVASLKAVDQGTELEKAKPIRVQVDEIGWYLFLCEQVFADPLCFDVSQASRALPFFVAIGERWELAPRVKGIDRKIDEILHHYKSEPDGLIFEILVALAYAANGWNVEFLDEGSGKTPDLLVQKEGRDLYVECKRQSRGSSYALAERNDFLRLWDAAKHLLLSNGQWIWLKGTFHVEMMTLPTDFLF